MRVRLGVSAFLTVMAVAGAASLPAQQNPYVGGWNITGKQEGAA